MSRKHIIIICLIISVAMMLIATSVYPGGNFSDPNAIGFDWTKNFFSNLFDPMAMNGAPNKAKPWALIGIVFHAIAFGLFFIDMADKLPARQATLMLKYIGIANILFTVLIATELHDIMVILAGSLSLIALFYITFFVMKSKLLIFKIACIVTMLLFYFTFYLYGSGHYGLLAIMQKVLEICLILLLIGLLYYTKKEDFISK